MGKKDINDFDLGEIIGTMVGTVTIKVLINALVCVI